MVSGVKIRDQVEGEKGRKLNDPGRKKWKSSKKDRVNRRNSKYISSGDEELENVGKVSRKKKWYASEESVSSSSGSGHTSDAERHMDRHKKEKKKKRCSDGDYRDKKTNLKTGHNDNGENISANDVNIVRKEMGLEWMLWPAVRPDQNNEAIGNVKQEEPSAEEMACTRGGGSTDSSRGKHPAREAAPAPHPALCEDGFISTAARAWYDQNNNFVMERRIANEVVLATGVDSLLDRFGLTKVLRMGEGLFSSALVREFYANAQAHDTVNLITSFVRHHPVEITPTTFSLLLEVPDNEDAHWEFSEGRLRGTKTKWLREVGRVTRHRGEKNKDVLPYSNLPTLIQRLLAEILSHQIRPQTGTDASDEDCVLLEYLLTEPPPPVEQILIPYVMFRQLHKVVSYLRSKKKKITPIFPFFIHHHLCVTLPKDVFAGVKMREGERAVTLQTVKRWGFMRLDDGTWVRGSSSLGAAGYSSVAGSSSAPASLESPSQGPATSVMQPPTSTPVVSLPLELQTHLSDILRTQQEMKAEQAAIRDAQLLITQRLERSDAVQATTAQILQNILASMGQQPRPPSPSPQ